MGLCLCVVKNGEEGESESERSMITLDTISVSDGEESVCEACVFVEDAMELCSACKSELKRIRDSKSNKSEDGE